MGTEEGGWEVVAEVAVVVSLVREGKLEVVSPSIAGVEEPPTRRRLRPALILGVAVVRPL
jgi:hypothetical protein